MDIAFNILEFSSMDNAVDFAAVNSASNNAYQQRMHQLFGSMNDLLLSSQEFVYYTKWKLTDALNKIPVFKQVYVNISLLIHNNARNISNLFDIDGFRFIRGIDKSSNLPFLIFLLSTDTYCTKQQIQERLIIVIFNHQAIDSIIFSQDLFFASITSWSFTRLKNDSRIISIESIVNLLRYGRCNNVLSMPNSVWIHKADIAETERCQTYVDAFHIIINIVCISFGVLGFRWVYLSTAPNSLGLCSCGINGLMVAAYISDKVVHDSCPDDIIIPLVFTVLFVYFGWWIPFFNALNFAVICSLICWFVCFALEIFTRYLLFD